MSEKFRPRKSVLTVIDDYRVELDRKTLDDAIKELSELKEKYGEDSVLISDGYESYSFYLNTLRLETDAEYKKRVPKEFWEPEFAKKIEEIEEEKERALYEKLKAKFEK